MNQQEKELKVFEYVKQEGAITIQEIRELLGVGFTTAERVLNNLVIDGRIQRKTRLFRGRNYFIYFMKPSATAPAETPAEATATTEGGAVK